MFEQYEVNGVYDEMFGPRGSPRRHYAGVNRRLTRLGSNAFERRRRMADVSFRNQGITFTVYNDARGVEKIFPFGHARPWLALHPVARSFPPSHRHGLMQREAVQLR